MKRKATVRCHRCDQRVGLRPDGALRKHFRFNPVTRRNKICPNYWMSRRIAAAKRTAELGRVK
jgi:hypothetical protein